VRNAKLEKKKAEIENGASSGRQILSRQIPEKMMAWLS
jgi:hypothetical protein